jgi:hypothetical protein
LRTENSALKIRRFLPLSRVSAPSDVIDSPPRRFWLAGNVGLAQICDLALGHLANVGLVGALKASLLSRTIDKRGKS